MTREVIRLPTVSVLMSVYKESIDYLSKAVDSILNQSYADLELIAVMDCPSNSEALALLQKRQALDERLIVLKNKKNIGLARSLNRAFRHSGGRYIARMDADDISAINRLEKQLKYLEDNKLDVVCTAATKIDENGETWGYIHPFSTDSDRFSKLLPFQNIIVHPTVVMRREVLFEMNGYRNFPCCQDYDLWLRMLSEGMRIGAMDEMLLYFRRHKESVSSRNRYWQLLNESYIRKLYRQRKRTGRDLFSIASLKAYCHRRGADSERVVRKADNSLGKYSTGLKNINSGKKLKGILQVVDSLRNGIVRYNFFISIRSRAVQKIILKIG